MTTTTYPARNSDGEVVYRKILQDKKTGMLYREHTSDKEMIRDSFKNYEHLELLGDDVVLDLGANVGGFSMYARDKVKKIIAVEACAFNSAIHVLNRSSVIGNYRITTAAVVPDDYEDDVVTFAYTKSAKNACSGKALVEGKVSKRYVTEEVPAIKFSSLINEHKPTVLKIDIEGGEYGILDRPIPECIRQIGGELHGMTNETFKKMHETIDILKKDWTFTYEKFDRLFGKDKLFNFVCKR